MSENAQNRSPRRITTGLTTLLAVIAIGISLFALYEVHRDDSGSKPGVDVSDGITEQEAAHILDRANDATNFVGNLLSFLEVSMAAISLALIVGGWMLRSMILDQIDESRELGKRIDRELQAYSDGRTATGCAVAPIAGRTTGARPQQRHGHHHFATGAGD